MKLGKIFQPGQMLLCISENGPYAKNTELDIGCHNIEQRTSEGKTKRTTKREQTQ